jgi:hypothetical protein
MILATFHINAIIMPWSIVHTQMLITAQTVNNPSPSPHHHNTDTIQKLKIAYKHLQTAHMNVKDTEHNGRKKSQQI